MNHERLWTLRNKLRVLEGTGMGGWVTLVVGIKEARTAWSIECGA